MSIQDGKTEIVSQPPVTPAGSIPKSILGWDMGLSLLGTTLSREPTQVKTRVAIAAASGSLSTIIQKTLSHQY